MSIMTPFSLLMVAPVCQEPVNVLLTECKKRSAAFSGETSKRPIPVSFPRFPLSGTPEKRPEK